jgi:hypothetical protein
MTKTFVHACVAAGLMGASVSVLAQEPWQQKWVSASKNESFFSSLTFSGKMPVLKFALDARNGANMGVAQGKVAIKNNHGVYQKADCRLDFTLHGKRVEVKQKGDCLTGMGVYFSGTYMPLKSYHPKKATLSSLDILTPNQDKLAKALLGKDYEQVVQNTMSCSDAEDVELHAKVSECFVRGIAVSNQYILMADGDKLWVAATIFEGDDTVVRYYTNQTDWREHMPKAIKEWYEQGTAAQFPLQWVK